MEKVIYGLFKNNTDYDTCETLVRLSFNRSKLEQIRKRENTKIRSDIKARYEREISLDSLNKDKLEKVVGNRFELEKYFIRKLEIDN